MKFKKLGRVMLTLALAGAAFALPATMTGCKNDHAEAKITMEYNGVSYVLEYTLYKNMYPQTVQHFIELADNGFYNNTIIHDCQSSNWYGGGYSYVDGEEDGSYATAYANDGMFEYLNTTYKAGRTGAYADLFNSGKLTPTVYRDVREGKLVDPYSTLIGEFTQNSHKIENGALKNSYGALKFYYTSISDDEGKRHVYLDKYGSAFGVQGEYRYNSATSLFTIQTGTSTSSDSTHCIFATLNNADTLRSLREEVVKNSAYEDVEVYVYDELLGNNKISANYRLKEKPIIVKSVSITKY